MDGAKTKNLFLRDNKGKQHFLIVMSADRAVELKSLSEAIGRTKRTYG
jgi:Ala-tRNA(Pro) deacylase